MKRNASIMRLAFDTSMVTASLVGCSDERSGRLTPVNSKPRVFVVNYPLKYFAERIAGDLVNVSFPAPRDVDPAFWNPSPEAISAFQQASLILLNGASYARWIERATLPESKIVKTLLDSDGRLIESDDTIVHAHGPEGEHSHAGVAITTWLDPQLAKEHARGTFDSLSGLLPQHTVELERNFRSLQSDLAALDEEARRITSGHADVPLLASHPVYQYFARRYQLNLRSLHWEPDEMPDDDAWQSFDSLLNKHTARWLMWEATPTTEIVDELKRRGVESFIFNPCANVPNEGDYLTMMRGNLKRLSSVFQQARRRGN